MADSIKGIGASAPRATQTTQAAAPAATAAPAQGTTETKGTTARSDAFEGSGDLHEEQRGAGDGSQLNLNALTGDDKAKGADDADAKKKAEAAKKKEEEERQALEDKKKELEAKIEAKQKELEQAQKSGDQEKVKSLSGELEGLQNELKALVEQQQAGQRPATPQAAGAGNQMPQAGAAPAGAAGAPQGAAPQQQQPFIPQGWQPPAGAPQGSYPPTPPSDGGYHPPTQTPSTPPVRGQITPNGSGQDAVNLARQYLGHNSADIRGAMPNFTAAGGQTNNCADFVSSALESTGRIQGHHINVREFEQSLLQQGYVRVPKEQARPGDVWINGSRGHTELVAEAGGNTLIGSNNDRPGHQVISEHRNPQGGYYYQLPERP